MHYLCAPLVATHVRQYKIYSYRTFKHNNINKKAKPMLRKARKYK